jgi:hypothetical protein
VVTSPEGDVAVRVLATEVETVGIIELGGVAVRPAEQRDQVLAFRDRDVAQPILVQRDALCQLHRTVESQQLLDCMPVERRVVAQAFELVAMLQQGVCSVADQVDGRLVPCDKQEERGAEQLLFT